MQVCRFLFLLLFMNIGLASANDCASNSTLDQVATLETQRLMQHPAALRFGLEDMAINLSISADTSGECQATLNLTFPQEDLDAVNAHLDQNPAKRILLGAQGYSVPAENQFVVPYVFALENSQITARNAENRSYQDMHNSLEFMYQLLTQLRAEPVAGASPAAWDSQTASRISSACSLELQASSGDIEQACTCRSTALNKTYSARQMALIEDLQAHPYSKTTDAIRQFNALIKEIDQSCGLIAR